MRRTICLLIFAILFASAGWSMRLLAQEKQPVATPTDGAEEPDAKEVMPREPTSEARAILRVVCRPESGLANQGLIESLLESPATIEKALADISKDVKLSPNDWPDISLDTERFTTPQRSAYVEMVERGEQRDAKPKPFTPLPAGVFMGDVTVMSYDKRFPAKEIMQGLRNALARQLIHIDWTSSGSDDDSYAAAARLYERSKMELLQQRRDYDKLAANLGLTQSPQFAEQRLLRIDTERQETVITLRALEAGREALEARIGEIAKLQEAAGASDPVVSELKKVVELRRMNFAALKEANKVSEAIASRTLREAEEAIAEAEAELAKYRRSATQMAGGERLAALQRRLDEMTIDVVQAEVKSQLLDHALEKASATRTSVPELDQKNIDLEVLEQSYREAAKDFHRLKTQRQNAGVTVTLIQSG